MAKRTTAAVKEGASSYIICECGQPKGAHRGPIWPFYFGHDGKPLRACDETGCSLFSAARSRWNEDAYRRGEFAGAGVFDRRPKQTEMFLGAA